MTGLRPSLITKAVFGALRGAGCQAPSQWKDPWAEYSMQITRDLFTLASFLGLSGTQLLFCCALIFCHRLVTHETRHERDRRMWIGLCLARLSPSLDLLVLLQGDRFTCVWPGTLPGFSDSEKYDSPGLFSSVLICFFNT